MAYGSLYAFLAEIAACHRVSLRRLRQPFTQHELAARLLESEELCREDAAYHQVKTPAWRIVLEDQRPRILYLDSFRDRNRKRCIIVRVVHEERQSQVRIQSTGREHEPRRIPRHEEEPLFFRVLRDR